MTTDKQIERQGGHWFSVPEDDPIVRLDYIAKYEHNIKCIRLFARMYFRKCGWTHDTTLLQDLVAEHFANPDTYASYGCTDRLVEAVEQRLSALVNGIENNIQARRRQ